MGEEKETREQLEARHEAEVEELDEEVKARLAEVAASAGKGKKAKAALDAAEREVEQWRYEQGIRHQEELEELEAREEGGGGGGASGEAAVEAAAAAAAAPPPPPAGPSLSKEEEEAQRAAAKKEKAQKKKQDKAQKQRDKEAELEREKAEAGPSRRELELEALTGQLAKHRPRLAIHEVIGDGHCLYRSLADQLRRYRPDLHEWEKGPDAGHEEMRSLCAKALRRRKDEYEPFAELANGEAFGEYCKRVESSADWGGHLELRALADELGGQILVYRAGENEPLSLGPSGDHAPPLRVTFHQFWLAAGEHYNSAVLLGDL